MALANYLKRRGGTYSVRITVPVDLIERVGKREIVKALGKVRDPATARRLGRERAGEVLAWFDRLRGEHKLTSEMIERECQGIARQSLDLLKVTRLGRRPQPNATDDEYEDDPNILGLDVVIGNFSDAIREDNFRPVAEKAAEIMDRLGVSAPKGSPEWNELCRALLRTHFEVYRVELERERGEETATIRLPLNPAMAGVFDGEIIRPLRSTLEPSRLPEGAEGDGSLGTEIDSYLASREAAIKAKASGAWTAKTAQQHRASLAMFRDFSGKETLLRETGRRHVGDFKMLLERLPTTHGKKTADRGSSLEGIADAADAAGVQRIGPRTIKRHLTALSGFFGWAKEHGRYDGDNPAAGFTFPRSRRPRDERPAWTAKELETLFGSPIWTGCASGLDRQRHIPGKEIIRDHRYWLPLLGAYAGLRLEEACQLQVDDIDTEDGIAFIHVRPGEGKQLKSKAAVRRVPVHPVLIAAGFLNHVAEMKRNGKVRVFPALKPGGPDKRYGYAETKKFTAYRRKIGCGEQGKDFHALRHSFTTALVAADVSRAIIDELTGHEGAGETSRYTKDLPLSLLHEAVSRIDYGFDAGHLQGR